MKSGVAAVKPHEGTSAVAPAVAKARATCTDSSSSSPPDMPSSRFILTSTGKSGAQGAAHAGDHLDRKAAAVLERPAVAVLPAIGPRGEELAEQVAVARVDLYRVEARLARQQRGADEVARLLGDVGLGHLAAERHAEEAQFAAGAERPAADDPRAGEEPAVPQLDRRRRAFPVHGVGEGPQSGQDLGAHPQFVAERPAVVAH